MSYPRIGLALGSGSARGLSHIGIIHALAEMGIHPHIVCGCSVGAMVGGAYAADHLDKLETWIRSLTRTDVLRFFDISLTSGGVILGERLTNVFREYIGEVTIESLSIPFSAVATELATGREIWFRTGFLLDAIRASMSLPGLFAPVQIDNNWLVDGGLVNPVPVSICRAMGADVVIAVNLNGGIVGRHLSSKQAKAVETASGGRPPEFFTDLTNRIKRSLKNGVDSLIAQLWQDDSNRPGMFDVMASSINIMQDRITRSRMAGDPPDVMLAPQLEHIGLLEVYRASEAIEEGIKCVRRAKDALSDIISIDRGAGQNRRNYR
ncbi:MAG TPA: patatin-like phospholipase RssA [Deltaproteobacteria bacterium]|jgi:NTE family protein|nr:patatin-like phospholipase RssA [Deltaproteobacteria bacterium]